MLILASLFSWNHIHPVLVHFSTALVPASIASDVLGKYLGRRSLTAAAWWMLLYGALATPLTVFAGWMWAAQFPASTSGHLPGLTVHTWLGFFLAIAFAGLAVWRQRIFAESDKPGVGYLLIVSLVVCALMYQGFLGGQMTLG